MYFERPVASIEKEKKIIEEKSTDEPIHYQNVQFNGNLSFTFSEFL